MGMRASQRKIGTVAAVATVLLGWVLLLPLGIPNPLVRFSYDLLQLVLPPHHSRDVVIIYMDEQAMQDYGQKPEQWNRSIHARLLDRLTDDRPRVVVFDVTLTQPTNPTDDAKLARAMGRNGRVVLAANKVAVSGIRLGYSIVPPLSLFETNATNWGTVKVQTDADLVGRRYDPGDDQRPGLDWAAATIAGASLTPIRRLREERWLNYYGSDHPFEQSSMTYTNAETREPGFFKDKAVFIGQKPDTLFRGEVTDVFGTPFTKWNSRFIPGVDITAIAYANLMHDDWLRRPELFGELAILLLTGLGAGLGLQRVRLRTAVWLSLLMALLISAAAIALVLLFRVWFAWVIVACAQLPCAFLVRVFTARPALAPEVAPTAARREISATQAPTAPPAPGRPLEIPDHTLLRCIGEGAYGQVWVARNAIGLYHAVKVIYRNRFGMEEPYERALRGIQKFMPVSRSHEGFVHILHVGRNEAAGFFFYIMEAGDDQQARQQIDPDTYAPKTLASELKQREVIPPREGLELMLALTDAVERLHQHHLIHRDIKPANIIFVNGRPKLADIDLVTDLSPQGEVSCIGTQGYMAPEGPGTAAADVFSLGRVLYVALTGKSPDYSPELPTRIAGHPECELLMELNDISCKACETEVERRYPSASAMRADLLDVFNRLPSTKVGKR